MSSANSSSPPVPQAAATTPPAEVPPVDPAAAAAQPGKTGTHFAAHDASSASNAAGADTKSAGEAASPQGTPAAASDEMARLAQHAIANNNPSMKVLQNLLEAFEKVPSISDAINSDPDVMGALRDVAKAVKHASDIEREKQALFDEKQRLEVENKRLGTGERNQKLNLNRCVFDIVNALCVKSGAGPEELTRMSAEQDHLLSAAANDQLLASTFMATETGARLASFADILSRKSTQLQLDELSTKAKPEAAAVNAAPAAAGRAAHAAPQPANGASSVRLYDRLLSEEVGQILRSETAKPAASSSRPAFAGGATQAFDDATAWRDASRKAAAAAPPAQAQPAAAHESTAQPTAVPTTLKRSAHEAGVEHEQTQAAAAPASSADAGSNKRRATGFDRAALSKTMMDLLY